MASFECPMPLNGVIAIWIQMHRTNNVFAAISIICFCWCWCWSCCPVCIPYHFHGITHIAYLWWWFFSRYARKTPKKTYTFCSTLAVHFLSLFLLFILFIFSLFTEYYSVCLSMCPLFALNLSHKKNLPNGKYRHVQRIAKNKLNNCSWSEWKVTPPKKIEFASQNENERERDWYSMRLLRIFHMFNASFLNFSAIV